MGQSLTLNKDFFAYAFLSQLSHKHLLVVLFQKYIEIQKSNAESKIKELQARIIQANQDLSGRKNIGERVDIKEDELMKDEISREEDVHQYITNVQDEVNRLSSKNGFTEFVGKVSNGTSFKEINLFIKVHREQTYVSKSLTLLVIV